MAGAHPRVWGTGVDEMLLNQLYGRFLRRVVLPIGDRLRRVPIAEALRHLEETQWWPLEKLQDLQNEKLRRLVAEAYANVPYYREMMDGRGLKPADIREVADLVKLPLLTKDVLRANRGERMLNRSIPMQDLVIARTSGTSGQPTQFYMSRTSRAYDRASYYRGLGWSGVRRGDLVVSIWGRPVVLSGFRLFTNELKLRWLTHEYGLNVADVSMDTMRRFVRLLWKTRPRVLRGYPAPLLELARLIRREGLALPPLEVITTTAEPVSAPQRETLEKTFGAPLFDQYGLGECNGVSCECARHSGLHIAMEHCVVEVVDPEGHPLPPGQTGLLALTNLDNEAFPFIRYVCGDEGALLSESCPCGLSLPLMSPVGGRTMDTIYGVNGTRVWGAFFIVLIMQLGWVEQLGIREYQFVQTDRDQLRFDLAADQEPSPAQMQEMVRRLQEYLGPMTVTYRKVDRIDRGPSNKLRYTVREWQPNDA